MLTLWDNWNMSHCQHWDVCAVGTKVSPTSHHSSIQQPVCSHLRVPGGAASSHSCRRRRGRGFASVFLRFAVMSVEACLRQGGTRGSAAHTGWPN